MLAAAVTVAEVAWMAILAVICAIVVLLAIEWRRWQHPMQGEGRAPRLLESTLAVLVPARRALDKAWLGVIDWGARWAEQEDLRDNAGHLATLAVDLGLRSTRLRVTAGPEAEASRSLAEAIDAVERTLDALALIREPDRACAPTQGIAEPTEAEAFEANRQAIDAARDRFVAASTRFEVAVRPILESRGTRPRRRPI